MTAMAFSLGMASVTLAHDDNDASMADCPMMKGYTAMKERGDKGMGFSQDKTTHHFRLTRDGGMIEVSTNDPNDTTTREQVRTHLEHLAKMFEQGNFDIPMFVHGETPAGVDLMTKDKSTIRYSYDETQEGGRVRIATSNPNALKAVHEFLRFQITEHRTGDPTEIVE